MRRGAVISKDGLYRYELTRTWHDVKSPVVFVMFNPSTADANRDDPTIRKCVGFARRLRFGGLIVVNLFAYRATDPLEIRRIVERDTYLPTRQEACGPENDYHLTEATRGRDVILAWGAQARWCPEYTTTVAHMVKTFGRRATVLRRLADGVPAHPLMLPYSCAETIRWR